MSAEVTQYLLSIEFGSGDTDRMNELAERAREGQLTTEETAKLDGYLHVGSLISILSVNQLLVQQLCRRAGNPRGACKRQRPSSRFVWQHRLSAPHLSCVPGSSGLRLAGRCERRALWDNVANVWLRPEEGQQAEY